MSDPIVNFYLGMTYLALAILTVGRLHPLLFVSSNVASMPPPVITCVRLVHTVHEKVDSTF